MHLLKALNRTPLVALLARKFWKLYNSLIFLRIEDEVRACTQDTVINGPFKGLSYPPLSHGTIHASTTPKLIGIYERELYASIERFVGSKNYDRVIVIGAAEGYYAVGLAIRLPSVTVVAFEADAKLRADLRNVAEQNRVESRLEILGFCDPDSLRALGSSDRTLIICDCEGGEVDLIRSDILMSLGPTDLIVECHDMIVPNCTAIVEENLSKSHSTSQITSSERTLSDLPVELLKSLSGSDEEVEWAIREHRHYEMKWIVAEKS